MPHGPGALPTLILLMALYVSMTVGGEVSMRGSGVDALASDTRASGGGSEGQFSKVLKYSCHHATTDSLSDNNFPLTDLELVRSHTSASVMESWQTHL